jgi:hypothetical protein
MKIASATMARMMRMVQSIAGFRPVEGGCTTGSEWPAITDRDLDTPRDPQTLFPLDAL